MDLIRNGDYILMGGSATATRGLTLLEGLGYRNIELFGYDCCYYEKPNLQEKKNDGRMKYEEITLETETYGPKKIKRTFWTEGQFMAQLQEFRNHYFNCGLNLTFHGDGMIPWVWRHKQAHKQYLEDMEDKQQKTALPLQEFLDRLDFNE
jgi:hypothetical protein